MKKRGGRELGVQSRAGARGAVSTGKTRSHLLRAYTQRLLPSDRQDCSAQWAFQAAGGGAAVGSRCVATAMSKSRTRPLNSSGAGFLPQTMAIRKRSSAAQRKVGYLGSLGRKVSRRAHRAGFCQVGAILRSSDCLGADRKIFAAVVPSLPILGFCKPRPLSCGTLRHLG